jgi:uridylate kinase
LKKSARSNEAIVLKLSGSAFFSDSFDPIVQTLKKFERLRKGVQIVIVAGGGSKAREYIAAGKSLGYDQASLDELGIAVSRANAQVLVAALGPLANPVVPESLAQLVDQLISGRKSRIVVCGGLHPGQSTNAVGALIAEKLRARFVNATDVDGVYDKDPNVFKDAKFLDSVSPEELSRLLAGGSMQAGGYDLMDPVALNLITRSRIPTVITRCDATGVSNAMQNKNTGGTTIRFVE